MNRLGHLTIRLLIGLQLYENWLADPLAKVVAMMAGSFF